MKVRQYSVNKIEAYFRQMNEMIALAVSRQRKTASFQDNSVNSIQFNKNTN